MTGVPCIGRLSSLPAVVLLSGCVVIPQPHDVVDLPRVTGTVRSLGAPVAGAVLTMNAMDNPSACDEPVARASTGPDGAFAFDEVSHRALWRLVVLAPSSPTHSMTLCIVDGDTARPLFAREIWASLPLHLEVDCELSTPSSDGEPCRISDWSGFNYIVGEHTYRQCREAGSAGLPPSMRGQMFSCETGTMPRQ